MIQYIIQPGDNLNRVADQFGITMAAIIAANAGLNP
ncbi:MAG: LysM domain, partial [Firmicutes bacterium]|nr:LysM domain [Bacillota bacterium]